MRISHIAILALTLIALVSCKDDNEMLTLPILDEANSGGLKFTTYDFSENAFGNQGNGLTDEQQTAFSSGNALFRTNWVTAPSSVQSLDGVGPLMNAISCGSCHFKDGRAFLNTSSNNITGLLFRLSIPAVSADGSPLPDPIYGGQLQDKSIQGVSPEAQANITYTSIQGTYADGSSYTLYQPVYSFVNWAYGDINPQFQFSPRIAPQVPGLGLLERVPESTLLLKADEFDSNHDGISGRPNYVWDYQDNQVKIGRFGWKANQPSLYQQTLGAFNGDMGITSSLFSHDHLTEPESALIGTIPSGGEPELSDVQAAKITLYMQALAVPARRNVNDADVKKGQTIFKSLACNSCHTEILRTDNSGIIEGLKNQIIRPYTDLLLHDMGEQLSDGRPDFLAQGNEWRTPPLWGLGLIKTVNGGLSLMHDGRARSIEEAILWHSGEAEKSKQLFIQLSSNNRQALLQFLESL
jgi:CxxC motif-containing protein (DUF1111 family)